MKRILYTFALLSMLTLSSLTAHAQSSETGDMGEGYAYPSFKEISQTLIMLGGLDINKQEIADEYARLVYCPLYEEKYSNDFDWNNIRRQIVSRVLEKKEIYRVQYEFYSVINLDRYDFEAQVFPLTEKSVMNNVGRMGLLDNGSFQPFCGVNMSIASMYFPAIVRLILHQPLNLTVIKMPMDEAELMLKKMAEQKIENRRLFIRFRFKAVGTPIFNKTTGGRNLSVDLFGNMKAIDLFLDKEMTHWIASLPVTSVR